LQTLVEFIVLDNSEEATRGRRYAAIFIQSGRPEKSVVVRRIPESGGIEIERQKKIEPPAENE